uniref:Cyclin-K n=1 Tax=Panagrellus redivivus TaxID=6233 RepID=A0A7E4ZZA9_PANRE
MSEIVMNANRGWIFSPEELGNSPSRREGMSAEQEQDLRRAGCGILWQIGISMKLSEQPTLSTACSFFHRFYMFHSFKEYPAELAALGCLFLAGKVEETPKKCKDIVSVATQCLPDKYSDYPNLTSDVFNFERILLATLGFDVYLENPYTFLVQYAKIFDLEIEKMREIVQFAWTFLNDCAGMTLCLEYDPEIIAIAILQLALKFYEIDMDALHWQQKEPNEPWWTQFVTGLTNKMIDELCHRALDYYEKHTSSNSAHHIGA